MTGTAPEPPELAGGRTGSAARRLRVRRVASFAAGAALLAAAVVVVVRSGPEVAGRWQSVSGRSPWLLAGAAALPVANWMLSAAGLWALTRRYGRVGGGEMAALVGSAWLLNYLPLRPGLLGRVAYHKAVNGIAVRDSARVVGWSIGCGGLAIALLGAAIALTPAGAGTPLRIGIAAAPLVILVVFSAAAARLGHREWGVLAALTLRYVDTLVWTGRYAVAFALLGTPIGLGPALVITAASQAAVLVPLTGNGLGLRQWSVGIAAAALTRAGVVAGGGEAAALGIAADLLNTAAEIAVAIPVGLICSAGIARRLARTVHRPNGHPS